MQAGLDNVTIGSIVGMREVLLIWEMNQTQRKFTMSWEKNVRKVEPYVAGEQPKQEGVIKLNTNECPYPPAPEVSRIAKGIDYDKLRLYPGLLDLLTFVLCVLVLQ